MAKRPKKAPPRILVVLSDIHAGSDVGLCPPEVVLAKGNIVSHGHNAAQVWLWKQYEAAVEWAAGIVGADEFALLLNGDMTEGTHHRTTEIIAATIEEHSEIARLALEPFTRLAAQTYVTLGTECHTLECEHRLAHKIGAVGGRARAKQLFRIAGTLVDATHHMPVTGRSYLEAGAMSILKGNAIVNAQRAGHQIPRVFLRGHRHVPGFFADCDSLVGVTGAWQFLTRHGQKVVPDSIPRPSILLLDWRGMPDDSLPSVHQFCPRPPQPDIHE